jgi:hypothetical protein
MALRSACSAVPSRRMNPFMHRTMFLLSLTQATLILVMNRRVGDRRSVHVFVCRWIRWRSSRSCCHRGNWLGFGVRLLLFWTALLRRAKNSDPRCVEYSSRYPCVIWQTSASMFIGRRFGPVV